MGLTKMTVTRRTSGIPSTPPASDHGLQLISRGVFWQPVLSTDMRAMMATMQMQMQIRRKNHRKPMMDQRRIWRTVGIVGLTCIPVMSTGMSARMAMMWIQMRRKKHCRPMMDQCRMWRPEGIEQ